MVPYNYYYSLAGLPAISMHFAVLSHAKHKPQDVQDEYVEKDLLRLMPVLKSACSRSASKLALWRYVA